MKSIIHKPDPNLYYTALVGIPLLITFIFYKVSVVAGVLASLIVFIVLGIVYLKVKYLVVDNYFYIRSKKFSLYKEFNIYEITVEILENNQGITLQSRNTYHYTISDSQNLISKLLLVNPSVKVNYKK